MSNDEFSDVEITVTDNNMVIPAHRLMLSRCQRFEQMIDAATVQDGKSQLLVDDMNYDTALQLIKYLYTDECDIILDNSI